MYELARRNPQLLKLEVLGKTHQGREYIALKMTQGASEVPDGSRPAVLYVATHHAREWISTEVDRRLLHWYIDRWRANDKAVKQLLKDTELWFVLVHNPDGYQYTFDVERLWRKNLRDNDRTGPSTTTTGSTRTATTPSTGATTTRVRRRCSPARPTAVPRRSPSPRRRPW